MNLKTLLLASALALPAATAPAHDIAAPAGNVTLAAFDLVAADVSRANDALVFRIEVVGDAGQARPAATGSFAGSDVHAYVWPTSLDSAAVGFEPGQGILALAVTFHPDFDDGAGGAVNRDVWHSHWVVLVQDEACGPGALKVKDIEAGTTPKLPQTWPGVPLLIDSPDLPPVFDETSLEVRVPLTAVGGTTTLAFDAVTAGLRVNANLHSPLLCVVAVFDVASGDLSLPGRVED